MSINKESDLEGMKKASGAVALSLKEMRNYARPGMSTKELDEFGGSVLKNFGANSAPALTYNFPGWTCISVNNEFCHGIPSVNTILKEGDLINIDVSAELNGFWSDNGGSFVMGNDINDHQKLIDASKQILRDKYNLTRFKKHSVVAIETFISTHSNYAKTLEDGWTMVGNNGGFMAQHEHTIIVTDDKPIILTEMNEIWN